MLPIVMKVNSMCKFYMHTYNMLENPEQLGNSKCLVKYIISYSTGSGNSCESGEVRLVDGNTSYKSARIEDVTVLPAVPAKGMEHAFSSLYYLVKHRVSHTTIYEPLLDLLEYLGVPVKSVKPKRMLLQYFRNITCSSSR